MPYIKPEARKFISPLLEHLLSHIGSFSIGDINYIITKLTHTWIENEGLRYENLNAAIGILDCVKMELYRMIAAPYEDKKAKENGCISKLDGDPSKFTD